MGETDSSVLISPGYPRRNGRTLVEDWEIGGVGIKPTGLRGI